MDRSWTWTASTGHKILFCFPNKHLESLRISIEFRKILIVQSNVQYSELEHKMD